MQRYLSLSLVLLVLGSTAIPSRTSRAQGFFSKVIPDTLKRIAFDDTDSTISVIFGSGKYGADSVFTPDNLTHTYRIASTPPISCTVNAELSDRFKGIDTIAVTLRNYIQGVWNWDMQFSIDGNPVPVQLNAVSTHFEWPVMTEIGNNGQIEVGAASCFNYYRIRNTNTIPVTISRIGLQTSDPLTVSPASYPLQLQPNEELIVQVCAKAGSTPDTLTGDLEVDLAAASSLRDTLRRHVVVYIVPLYLDHCLRTSYADLGPIYPWNTSLDTTVYLENRLTTPLTVTAIQAASPDSNAFVLTGPAAPFTIAGGGTDSLHVTLNVPRGPLPRNLYGQWDLDVAGTDSNGFECPSTYFRVWCNVVDLNQEDRDLARASFDDVFFFSWGQPVYRLVTLRNSGTANFTLRDASINGVDASAFTMEHLGFEPGTVLRPGDSTVVYLGFPSSRLPFGEYHGTLSIDYDGGTASIPLRGSLASIGVADRTASSRIALRPNPSNGTFEIDLPDSPCDIWVTDVLGQQVAEAHGVTSGHITSTELGQHLASGAYIVRVESVGELGHKFVMSRRIAIQR